MFIRKMSNKCEILRLDHPCTIFCFHDIVQGQCRSNISYTRMYKAGRTNGRLTGRRGLFIEFNFLFVFEIDNPCSSLKEIVFNFMKYFVGRNFRFVSSYDFKLSNLLKFAKM